MARDARLALPQDLDQLAHGPFALRADRQQPQARRIARRRGCRRAERRESRGSWPSRPSRMRDRRYVDIFIFFCQPSRGHLQRPVGSLASDGRQPSKSAACRVRCRSTGGDCASGELADRHGPAPVAQVPGGVGAGRSAHWRLLACLTGLRHHPAAQATSPTRSSPSTGPCSASTCCSTDWLLEPVARAYRFVTPEAGPALGRQFPGQSALAGDLRQRRAAGRARARRHDARPVHDQHHAGRVRACSMPASLFRLPAPRRGFRPDARRLGRARRALSDAAAARAVERPRHDRAGRRLFHQPAELLLHHHQDERWACSA